MKKLIVVTLIVFSLMLPAGIQGSMHLSAQVNAAYFPETGHTVKGRFLHYWRERGGLRQQGYPISEELQEVSEINGKTYTMQYFERAVFELHPENQPPYDVLLTLLGTFQYKQKYPGGAPGQVTNTSANSVLFPQTGKRVGGSFLLYWQQYGGLQQHGYPISDEIQEVSPLDGKTYTVQYFERAVMEWHPGNVPPNDVLLSHIGKFRYEAKYVANTQSSPTPKEVATRLISRTVLGSVGAYGQYLFWLDTRDGGRAIYGYELDEKREFLIKRLPLGAGSFTSDGNTLAWTEGTQAGDTIQGYDLSTGRESTLVEASTHNEFNDIAVHRNVLYYVKTGGLFGRDLSSGGERVVVDTTSEGSNPLGAFGRIVTADGILLWSRMQSCGKFCPMVARLFLLKLDGSQKSTVIATTTNGYGGYEVSGENVVWSGENDRRIYLYNMSTGFTKLISPTNVDSTNPLINGNLVAWTEGSIDRTSMKLYNIAIGSVSTVVPPSDSVGVVAAQAIISSEALAYTVQAERGTGRLELYVSRLK